MTVTTDRAERTATSAVLPTVRAIAVARPLPARDVAIVGGFWADRIRTNRVRSLAHGYAQLDHAGNLANFRLAAGAKGTYQALGAPLGLVFPFLDTDVYKWLEAVGWELGHAFDADLAAAADEVIGLVEAAQRPDGYLNTYVQVVGGGEPYRDLQWGHELYCFGHLVQAAIAWHRSIDDDRLLAVALRAVATVEAALGPGGRDGIDGHPEFEMALVELYRTTGDARHLELAGRMVRLRGHGLLGPGRFGPAYWQDHLPTRDAAEVAGHAVRQMYLDCGVVDLAVELGDQDLLQSVLTRWHDMVETRTYLTGGLGSRHNDEAFGDPYELPPDVAYAETCASIASVMLAWRLLLATGEPACADLIERTIYNGVLTGVSQAGTSFFYVNPLQRRTERAASREGEGERQAWFACACCPPNIMRLLSSWEQYLATTDGSGIRLHQYADVELRADVAGGLVRLRIETDYPWSGEVAVTILETPATPWTLSLRIPGWSGSATIEVAATGPEAVPAGARSAERTRGWTAGERVDLSLEMAPRVTRPHPRVDAVRGCVALERGPLVYCVETADLPSGVHLEDVRVDADVRPTSTTRADLPGSPVGLSLPASLASTGAAIELGAIPYFSWAHRQVEAMRVWIPVRTPSDPAS
jgi:uncharacterized protein